MYKIENKFELGEECYSVYRKPIHYKCPICEGNGKFRHNGYMIRCTTCNETGRLHNAKQHILDICKVKIKTIKGTIRNGETSISYKVEGVGEDKFVNVHNRSESNLFKTIEKAEKYCVDVNAKEVSGEF